MKRIPLYFLIICIPMYLLAESKFKELKGLEGIYIPHNQHVTVGFNPERVVNFLSFYNDVFTEYVIDCTGPGCQNYKGDQLKLMITDYKNNNLWKYINPKTKSTGLRYIKKLDKDRIIFSVWYEKKRKPLDTEPWVRVPKEHEAAFKKHLGLK